MQEFNFDVDFVIPYTQQKVKINQDTIEIGQSKINCNQVEAVRYGVSLVGTEKKPQKKIYTINVKSLDGKTASIQFESKKATQLMEEDHTYAYIMSGLWHHVKKHLVSSFIEKLNNQENLQIGNAKFNYQGFEMKYKNWFWGKTKTVIVPWSLIQYSVDKGILHISDQYNRKRKIQLSLHHDWNAVVLQTLMHYLWQDNRRMKLSKSEKN